MDLSPYLDTLRRDLGAAAVPGGEPLIQAAESLSGALDASARLCLLQALVDATAEITTRLDSTSVEVRLRGREADFVVTQHVPAPPVAPGPPTPPAPPLSDSELTRITLRLPEQLKEQVERAAAAEGISVNAWLVRAIAMAVGGQAAGQGVFGEHGPFGPNGPFGPQGPFGPGGPPPPGGRRSKRITGYAQA